MCQQPAGLLMLHEITPEVISTITNESKCHVMDALTVTDWSKFEDLHL